MGNSTAIPEATRANAEATEAIGAPKSNQYQRRSAQVVAKRECSSGHQTSGNQGQRRSDQVVAKRECSSGHQKQVNSEAIRAQKEECSSGHQTSILGPISRTHGPNKVINSRAGRAILLPLVAWSVIPPRATKEVAELLLLPPPTPVVLLLLPITVVLLLLKILLLPAAKASTIELTLLLEVGKTKIKATSSVVKPEAYPVTNLKETNTESARKGLQNCQLDLKAEAEIKKWKIRPPPL